MSEMQTTLRQSCRRRSGRVVRVRGPVLTIATSQLALPQPSIEVVHNVLMKIRYDGALCDGFCCALYNESCSELLHSCSSSARVIAHPYFLKNVGTQEGVLVQANAISGATAGVIVSMCLHPIDTIKTVIQRSSGSRNFINAVGHIVEKRGFSGLYRGILSNLSSSAPISAIYTSTYESVKTRLIKKFPARAHAAAHCIAGAMASIATSFVYTPSECVKQRVQIGLYPHAWSALHNIVRNEGFLKLYTGWGAVLCRNVPQSVIKFLTYEQLKALTIRRKARNSKSDLVRDKSDIGTANRLLCGALSGCAGALFTTPFDVIKTRLQTQAANAIIQNGPNAIPGGTTVCYRNVGHALVRIVLDEGFFALYRGIIPRIVIYMSQGAIFFASYEATKLAIEKHQANLALVSAKREAAALS